MAKLVEVSEKTPKELEAELQQLRDRLATVEQHLSDAANQTDHIKKLIDDMRLELNSLWKQVQTLASQPRHAQKNCGRCGRLLRGQPDTLGFVSCGACGVKTKVRAG